MRREPDLLDDTIKDAELIAKKILSTRVFNDDKGVMWKAGVKDVGGEVLCVSQFTLMATTTKGSKPDFHKAMVRFFRLYSMLHCGSELCPLLRLVTHREPCTASFLPG